VGEQGELLVSGPSVASGYWQQPELTAKAFVDGWFHTGDAAMRDEEGYFYIVDRKKDMYISGGENVYPAEVEAALAELLEVGECAVIGVPDQRWGEVGRAYVNPAPGRRTGPGPLHRATGQVQGAQDRGHRRGNPPHNLRQGAEAPAEGKGDGGTGARLARSAPIRTAWFPSPRRGEVTQACE
jgi:acyl-CoA synthetase (AMP-forming)/AMP-acid ligase II